MASGLSEYLPEPVSPANEKAILELVKRKAMGAARVGVMLLHAMEKRFGPEAREVLKEMIATRKFPPRPDRGDPAADLRKFCARMDGAGGVAGSHEMRRVVDEPDRVGFSVTQCLWAEIYRELGEPDLGWVFCAGDEPAIEAYNPGIGFKRTKTLMRGDGECDHLYYVKK